MLGIDFNPVTDPYFYLACIPAIMIVGLSKGGLGGGGAIFGVPIMSLAIDPIQAAAIMLPPLVLMNYAGAYSLNFKFDRRIFITMMPGALIGVGIGWALANYMSPDAVRFVIGVICLLFLLNYWFNNPSNAAPRPHSRKTDILGQFWGTGSGFTSFVCHAGAPIVQVHTIPFRIEPVLYTSTMVMYFTIVDTVKLVPYYLLGQFDVTNLATSILLMPYAVFCVFLGTKLVKHINIQLFYRILNALLFIVACYLLVRSSVDLGFIDWA